MDLSTLGIIIVSGVVLLTSVAHMTGGSRTTPLTSEQQVRQIWELENPGIPILAVQFSDDETVALLHIDGPGVGVVLALGDNLVCRHLRGPLQIRARNDAIWIRVSDFGIAPIRVNLCDDAIRSEWLTRLEDP